MLPDLQSLRCFEAAARHASFRAAAREVGLSPPAFSDRIRRLEEDLGVQLFHRTTRRIALTPAGQRLLPQARRCLDEARRCQEVATDAATRAPFDLRLGTRYELGMSWLVPALQPLSDSRPERTIHLYFGDSADLLHRLKQGDIDALVSSVRLSHSAYAYASLHQEAYTFVASPDLLEREPLREAADATRHTLIDADSSLTLFRYLLDALDQADVWPFRQHVILGTIAAIRQRVLDGAGVAVLPRYFVGDDIEAGRLVEPLPEITLRTDAFRLVWQSGHLREEELLVLAESLRQFPLR